METQETLKHFAFKAIEVGKYVGGTAGAIKVVLREIPAVLREDEPQDLGYLKVNAENLLQRSGKAWESATFNVYVTTFRRLVEDFLATGGNVYKLRDPRPRMARPMGAPSAGSRLGVDVLSPAPPSGILGEASSPAQRTLALPLPNGGVSLAIAGRLTLEDWEHALKMMDEQVRYMLRTTAEPPAEPAVLEG